MEGIPSQATKVEKVAENIDLSEAIEKAKELHEELLGYDGTDIVGQAACDQVESLAQDLKIELSNIPPAVRVTEGLPWHPHEGISSAVV